MTRVEHLLIGGGVASLNAAKQLARKGAGGGIVIVTEEHLPPYNLPLLSKDFLVGKKQKHELILESEDALAALGVKLRMGTRIERLDIGARTALTSDGETLAFSKLLIATGARPIRLSIPGSQLPGVHYVRNIEDSAGLAAEIAPGRRAAIIGAGFIGLEVAASLASMGLSVTVFESMSQIWPRFADRTLADYVRNRCEQRGIRFVTDTRIVKILGDSRVSGVVSAQGQETPCDLVCVGIGITPNVELAKAAGLTVDDGIVVDTAMQTNIPDVYAAGDVCNYPCAFLGRRRRAEHWGHAEYSGQVAGANMGGGTSAYDFLSYVWSDIFDMHIEAAGEDSGYDQAILRGSLENGSFNMLYVSKGCLIGYCGINAPAKEFTTLRKLIKNRISIADKLAELQDPAANLRALL